ncbi:MAG: hypothetical protein FD165_444 [Gammaproteobacteria bacterium]|nr:MAG: hypothetical protein FD165_444 [Gammaproteobacteria bacterium]TND02293.1 MAG: hypothetical protein FD120_2457 [Gammaproteobacteria bacterium]
MSKGLFNLDTLVEGLQQQRDEIKVQLHLAKAEARDEWAETEKKLEQLKTKASRIREEAGAASSDVIEAAKRVAEEIKRGYARIRKQI